MKKTLVVAGIFAAALTVLIWVGVVSAMIPVVKVSDVRTAALETPGQESPEMAVNDGQVATIESLTPLRFTIKPREGMAPPIRVESGVSVSDQFQIGRDVGLRGTYNREKDVFEAYQVTTACPSKYEASEEKMKGGPYSPSPGAARSGTPGYAPPASLPSSPRS